jgi:hypothetical protein
MFNHEFLENEKGKGGLGYNELWKILDISGK